MPRPAAPLTPTRASSARRWAWRSSLRSACYSHRRLDWPRVSRGAGEIRGGIPRVSWPYWLGLITWAAVTGALVSAGIRRRSIGFPLALAALLTGALVPVGLVLLAGGLNHVWPGTTGPTDAPVMTGLLFAYALVIPWTLGRLIRRWVPAYRPTTDKPMTISQ
jgi:hypothetical protein